MTAAAPGPGRPSLWRHRDFMLLWTGQSISELGSSVTLIALPLTAVVVLRASVFQVGGGLFGLLGAGALIADAVSYAVSTVSLLLIRTREPPTRPERAAGAAKPRLRAELFAGLSFIVHHPVLRKIAACTATANLFVAMAISIEIIFLIRVLHVRPAYTGLLVAVAGLGGVAAGILSGRLARWIGSARIIWVSMLVFSAPGVLLPLAKPGWRLSFVVVGGLGLTFSGVLYNIAQLSYRQAICPPGLLGRLNAAIRWIVWGTLPLGAVIGGTLGSVLGVRPTLWIGMAGSWAAALWVLFSPLRGMRDVPGPGEKYGAGWIAGPRPGRSPGPGRRGGRDAARPATQEQ